MITGDAKQHADSKAVYAVRGTPLRADQPIDAVFTDIAIGGSLNGWDVAEKCRAMWTDIAVVYTSGRPNDRAHNVFGSEFLSKPYRAEQVLAMCLNPCSNGSQRAKTSASSGRNIDGQN